MVKITAVPLMSLLAAGLTLIPAYAASQTPSTSGTSSTASRTTTRAATARWNEQDYKLGAGDKLRVEVYKQDQLSQSLQVRPDGKITLPLVGDVTAAGRTSIELRESLTTALKEYVQNPVVTVIVQEAVSAQVHLIGEVANPGTQVLNGSTTVLQALARAGGLREFANKGKIHILRVNGTRTETMPFDYRKALKGEIEPVYLQPGDTIVVP
jgi:polysaccharide export outer membrane protein